MGVVDRVEFYAQAAVLSLAAGLQGVNGALALHLFEALIEVVGFLEVPFLNAEAYGIGPNPLSREQKTFRTAPLTASDRIRSVLLLMAYKWLKWLIIALKYASKATGLSSEVHDRDDL